MIRPGLSAILVYAQEFDAGGSGMVAGMFLAFRSAWAGWAPRAGQGSPTPQDIETV